MGCLTHEFALSQNQNIEYVDPTTDQPKVNIEEMMQDDEGDVEVNPRGEFESEGESDEDYIPLEDRKVLNDCSFYSDASNMDNTG